MTIYLNTGPFLTIPDQVHPGQYRVIHNPDWDGELPEIVSFTNFLKWNYILEYGNFIRKLHSCHQLPLPWYFTGKVDMPEDEASDYILNFFDNFVGEPDWEDYRRLIDLVK